MGKGSVVVDGIARAFKRTCTKYLLENLTDPKWCKPMRAGLTEDPQVGTCTACTPLRESLFFRVKPKAQTNSHVTFQFNRRSGDTLRWAAGVMDSLWESKIKTARQTNRFRRAIRCRNPAGRREPNRLVRRGSSHTIRAVQRHLVQCLKGKK